MALPAEIRPETRSHVDSNASPRESQDNMLLSKRLSMITTAIPQTGPGALATPTDKPVLKSLKSPIPPGELSVIERSKQLAAWSAVDDYVKPHYRVIGIGSGSTVPYVVERIVNQGAEANKDRVFIPTGFQSKELIVTSGLNLGDVDQYPTIDVTLDGADEVDTQLNCIKGGGACHLREKVIAEAALTFILVADYRKNVERLGTNFKAGVPIEVVPFAYAKVLGNLHNVLGSPKAHLRMAVAKAGPVVTDNGNFVIDAPFDEDTMKDPYTIMAQIKMLTGVVEVGLFCHMATAAYFGNQVNTLSTLPGLSMFNFLSMAQDGSVTVKTNDGQVRQVESQ
ncbi:ribose-5-phosphate isomerase rki1 [Marasmius tenuissimus]|uniref:Ribose-5-phosphate isomerase n=1 Tax=Marasmius tenuissimus TaxID=585030 RepID=A0ABR2ZS83_9AGAR